MSKVIAIAYPMSEERREQARRVAGAGYEVAFARDIAELAPRYPEIVAALGGILPESVREMPSLQWVQTSYAGVEGLVSALSGRDVVLTNASGAYGKGISEHVLTQLLMLLRHMPGYVRGQDRREWRFLGGVRPISDLVVTVVGLGDLGGCFARLVSSMGGHVRGVRRRAGDKPEGVAELFLTEGLDEALDGADVVALCLPHTAQTAGILSRERIAALKPGAIILNTGRGSAIDQDALTEALADKKVLAGLDVTTPEPLPADHPLWGMENLLLTPHVSGGRSMQFTQNFVTALCLRNLENFVSGKPMENQVDVRVGY